jgi:type IV secretion system protein VirB10
MSVSQPSPEEERGVSPTAGKRRWGRRFNRGTLVVGLVFFMVGVLAWGFYKQNNPTEEEVSESRVRRLSSVVPYEPLALPQQPAPVQPTPAATAPQRGPATTPAPGPTPALPQQAAAPASRARAVRPSVITYAQPPAPAGRPNSAAGGGSGQPNEARSDVIFAKSKIGGAKAALMGDMTLLLTPGLIPCTLDWRVDSTVPGPVQCTIPFDIRPRNVKLLSAGSKVHGAYQSNIQNGQKRLGLIAEWIEDPSTGCFVAIPNNPMGDTLGTSGVEANIDNHYLERFGAAVVLSLTQSALQLAQAAMSDGGGNNTYLSFGGGGGGGVQSLASQILQSQINIPPTATIHQGTPIAVLIRQPVDFSGCYDVIPRER